MTPEGTTEAEGTVPLLHARPAEWMDQDQLTCDICGGQMFERQCKILCPNCGYTRDCSDP